MENSFDVKVTRNGRVETFLNVRLDYVNSYLLNSEYGYTVLSINFARVPSSAILADCLAHPNSVTNG